MGGEVVREIRKCPHGLQPSWWSLTCVILVSFSMEPKNWWWTSYIFIRYSILFPSVLVLGLPNLPLRTGEFTIFHHFFTIFQLVMWSAEVPAAVVDFREPTCCICYEAEPSVQSMICGHKARRRGDAEGTTGNGGGGVWMIELRNYHGWFWWVNDDYVFEMKS